MIKSVRNIASSTPRAEVWRYLRLYLNSDRTARRVRQIHNITAGSHEANISKQCIQVGYCIRQAEEYFRASESVGLATKPLLLYYGCVALSRALILIKKDGTYSLDGMRKAKKHRHHGLILDEGAAEQSSKEPTAYEFFSHIRCSCFVKEDGTPWGHFPVFYEALDPSVFSVHVKIRESDRSSYLERDIPQVCADALNLSQVKDTPLQSPKVPRLQLASE